LVLIWASYHKGQMDQWIDVASKFGLPVMMLLGAAYFLLKHVWPFVTRQIEEAHAQRKEEIAKFVETIRARDVLMAEDRRQHLKALETLTNELRGIRKELRDNSK
jgi:hypothetical protein